jgi:hypothetical protein
MEQYVRSSMKFLIENNTDESRKVRLFENFKLNDIIEDKFRCIYINDNKYQTSEQFEKEVKSVKIRLIECYISHYTKIRNMRFVNHEGEKMLGFLTDPYQTNMNTFDTKERLTLENKGSYIEFEVASNTFLFINFCSCEFEYN